MTTGWRTPFIDVVLCVVLVLLVLVHPPRKDADAKPPGEMAIEMTWPARCPADIDLWIKPPGERAVGYSNRNGTIVNLLRDDLGFTNDLSFEEGGVNLETAYARFHKDGEYIINVHGYSKLDKCERPVPVHVRVYRRNGASNILRKTVHVSKAGDEITVARITLDGNKVTDISDLPIKIRGAE